MRRLVAVLGLALFVAFAAPIAAQDKPTEEHDTEPCVPESIFDDSCDEGGGQSKCFGDCRACTTINNRFGCYKVYWAAACSCFTDWAEGDGGPVLVCGERGSCTVVV